MTKETLKEIRTAMGLNQAQMAEKMGYKRYITILEKEKGREPLTDRDKIILRNFLNKV